jgi:hypothetical protein
MREEEKIRTSDVENALMLAFIICIGSQELAPPH